MKKIGWLLLAVLLCGCSGSKGCKVEEGELCFDAQNDQYLIEEEAHLRVTVDSEAYGKALQQLWDKRFPEHQGAIEIQVIDQFDGKSYLNTLPDVGLIWANEAARLDSWFYPIDSQLEEQIASGLLSQYGESVNRDQFVYVPMLGYGWVFSSNLSMLQAWGVPLEDENQDGLPDALDSFEKITDWADSIKEPLVYRDQTIETLFQLNWQDPVEAMAYLSLAGFCPFAGFQAEDPGWDSEEFLAALEDLAQLGQQTWSLPQSISAVEQWSEEDPRRQESSSGGAEFYLSKADRVFSMVGTWMYVEEEEQLTEQDFSFSAMPTWHDAQLHPYTLSAGYVIRKDTQYPNACHELLRLIRSDDGLQAYALEGTYPLLYNYRDKRESKEGEAQPIELDFRSENQAQISYALMEGREESMVAFAADPQVRGWSMIEETGMFEVLQAVFEQQLTPEDAQQQIVEKTAVWMQDYLIEEEEE